MNSQEIYLILSSGSPGRINDLIEGAPQNSFKSAALAMAAGQNPATLVLGITSMVMEYCVGSNPEYGASLAEATHKLGSEIYNSLADHGGLFSTTLSNLASQHLNALNLLGRSQEVLVAADVYLPIYSALDEMENYPSLVLARATALFNLNRIDESRESLENLDCFRSPGSQVGKDRLLNRIYELMGDVTEIESTDSAVSLRQSLANALGNTDTSVLGDHQEEFNKLQTLLADEAGNPSLNPNDIDQYKKMLEIIKTGEGVLTRGGSSITELTMQEKSREASSIFHPSALSQPSVSQIESSLVDLMKVYNWSKENNSKELLQDALWGIYLCHSRLDHSSEAADALIELRTHLESQRAGILNPTERAGAFSTYSQLFNVMCERLFKAGRYFELLQAMEASKGRGIADILTRKQNRPVPDADVYGAVSKLPALTQKHHFNYLSFYLDRYEGEATIYMVMMCKDGQAYSTEPARLDESLLNSALANLDPDRWGQPGNRGRKIPNAPEVLAPLVSLIDDLLHQGPLQAGDHICYTADEQLNNLPLHYLPLANGLLIDSFSFSRIHNVAQLEYILEKDPSNPNHAEVFVVPTIQDTEKENWAETEKNLNRPAEVLAEYFDVQVLKDRQASLVTLSDYNLPEAILHFSSHGVFQIGDSNPFTGSGLVLSDGNRLPDRNAIAHGDLGMVLTPQKLVDSDIDLHDSHVSMMACVSGLSREGLGRDALGLDWALVNAGASSILSSHWYISAKLASGFFERFYHNWLGKNQSRAVAFQSTVKELQGSSGFETIHQCSAFSLSGDWR